MKKLSFATKFAYGFGQQNQEGILFAATSFSGKLSSGMGHFLAGIGLDLIQFPVQADPAMVAPETIRNLGVLNLIANSIAFLGIYSYTHYKISHESYAATLLSETQMIETKRADP